MGRFKKFLNMRSWNILSLAGVTLLILIAELADGQSQQPYSVRRRLSSGQSRWATPNFSMHVISPSLF